MGWPAPSGTLGLVLEYFLKTTAVLTLALIAAAAARRRPAAFRHFVLSSALAGLLLLPLLSLAPVGWRTPLLPVRPAAAEARGLERLSGRGLADERIPSPINSVYSGRPADAVVSSAAPGMTPDNGESAPSPGPAVPLSKAPRHQVTGGLRPPAALSFGLALAWSAGLTVLVLRLVFGLAGAVKLTKEATALGDPVWRLLLERFLSLVTIGRRVRLKTHPRVLVPLTWGWRRPVVLMPADTEAWTEEERSSALFHELSHIKRSDFLVMLLVRASLALFWFSPLCWVVYRELRKEQEIACDELVLRAGIKPSIYAASLLALRRSAGFRWNPSAALLGMLGKASFNERLAAILKQRLTFKEVKMKTRITLAAAVVLAVAMIGTARPAVGIEKTAASATLIETALPAAAPVDVVLPEAGARQEKTEKAVVQEKEQEKARVEKEKAAAVKKADVMIKAGGKAPIVITITEGDSVKTLTLAEPLTITSGEGGHVLVLTSEGKEVQVLKGEPLRLEIKGGEIEFIKEGKALKVGEGGVYTIVKEREKDGRGIVLYGTTEGKTEEATKFYISERKAGAGVKVIVGTAVEGGPTVAWTVKKPGKEGTLWVTKEFSGKPASGIWVAEGGKAFAFSPGANKEMLEKVRALQEQVQAIKAKKLDIAALEESLKKLETELKGTEQKLGELKMRLEKGPGEFTVVRRIGEGEAKGDFAVWVAEGDEAKDFAKVGISTDDSVIQIVVAGKGASPQDFEEAVAKLKTDLPDGYKLQEQKFDAETGTMHFKIAAPEGTKIDEKIVRKLVDSVKTGIKSKK